ncbi:hypothetical protein KA005_18750 [bacterium]|nr:hypothetical protein [bacterium]
MREWQIEDLNINVDAVLRGQGANPDIIRSRSPRLVDTAEKALEVALPQLEPEVLVKELEVIAVQHNFLELEEEKKLTGALVTGHLVGARFISTAVCTVGSKIDEYASEVMEDDIVLGLAVDGVGSAAVEALANAVCREIEMEAAAREFQTTIPLSPGMIGWGVEKGQPLIFDLLDPAQIGVELTPYNLMVPRKSLSIIIGVGPNINSGERICDYCAMRETCRYQDHYDQTQI